MPWEEANITQKGDMIYWNNEMKRYTHATKLIVKT